MSLVTIIWAMIASSCLTLALVHVLVWWRRRGVLANLLFSLLAVAVAAYAGFELFMMRADAPAAFGVALRWAHVPVWVVIVSLVWFMRLYLRAGRLWLAWTVCGIRTLSLILDFVCTPNLNYREITSMRQVSFLGETVFVAEGVPNPLMLLGQLSLALCAIFVADAAITVWRRGERRQALLLGGSMVLFTLVGTEQSIFKLWGVTHAPLTASLSFMGVVAAMGYELSQGLIRAARLSEDLRESQKRMALATHAANVGIWVRDLVGNQVWATDKWRELLGLAKSEQIDLNGFLQKVHQKDRDVVREAFAKALTGQGVYEVEYRVIQPNGQTRWIASRGHVEFDIAGKPVLERGASIDITARKEAEEAAHDLSGRLINAQEEEQMRLARDLHDDFSQSLALLSNELELFGQNPPAEPRQISNRMRELSAPGEAIVVGSSPAFARVASGETGATRPPGSIARFLQGIRDGA